MDMKGNIYWITGLAGAGKTSIGKLLFNKIKEEPNTILDGTIVQYLILTIHFLWKTDFHYHMRIVNFVIFSKSKSKCQLQQFQCFKK